MHVHVDIHVYNSHHCVTICAYVYMYESINGTVLDLIVREATVEYSHRGSPVMTMKGFSVHRRY